MKHTREAETTVIQEDGAMSYDTLIRGGRVIDPAQNLNGSHDVAVKDGRIAAVAARRSRLSSAKESWTRRASWCCRA